MMMNGDLDAKMGGPEKVLWGLLTPATRTVALFMLWRWFAMPLGAPALPWLSALGLLQLTVLLRRASHADILAFADASGETNRVQCFSDFVNPVYALVAGFVVHEIQQGLGQ